MSITRGTLSEMLLHFYYNNHRDELIVKSPDYCIIFRIIQVALNIAALHCSWTQLCVQSTLCNGLHIAVWFLQSYEWMFCRKCSNENHFRPEETCTEFKLHYIVPKHMGYDQNHFYCSYSLRSLSFTLICSIMASFVQSSSHLPHSALLWKLCRVWRNKEECLDKIWSQVVTGDAFKMHDKTSCKC